MWEMGNITKDNFDSHLSQWGILDIPKLAFPHTTPEVQSTPGKDHKWEAYFN